MDKAIREFPRQFAFEPIIKNSDRLGTFDKFILAGMGGSHLAGDILHVSHPYIDIINHEDYGLPEMLKKELRTRLIIVSSYSGNTEEAVSALDEGMRNGYAMAAISMGGTLLSLAKKYKIPYIQLPNTGIQPRMALGFSIKALLSFMRQFQALKELSALSSILKADEKEKEGKALAARLKGLVPIVYTSRHNRPIGYNWKIKLNETGKIPAFYNVFPELNHNEITGFDVKMSTKELSKLFHFLFLFDPNDHPFIAKRMLILKKLYEERGLSVEAITIEGPTFWYRLFSSILFADWTALYTAKQYKVEAEQVPMLEEFKRLVFEMQMASAVLRR